MKVNKIPQGKIISFKNSLTDPMGDPTKPTGPRQVFKHDLFKKTEDTFQKEQK